MVRADIGAVCFHSRCGNGFVRFSGGSAGERWRRSSLNRFAMNVAEASSCALPVSRPPYAGPLKVRISASMRSTEICSSADESAPALERVDSREEPANRGDARKVKHPQAKQVVKQRFI